MGVKETMRGLGCMAKGAGCLLAIFAGYALVKLIFIGFILLCIGIFGALARFHEMYSEQIIIGVFVLIALAIIAIILAIANAIGENADSTRIKIKIMPLCQIK